MKRLSLILALLAMPLYAQTNSNYLTITTAYGIKDSSGTVMSGTFCAYATDSNDNAIPFLAGDGAQVPKGKVCRNITAGTIASTLQLANPKTTNPLNINYHVTVTNGVTKQATDYPGVYINVLAGVTSWDWSLYNPSTGTIPVNIISGPAGPTCSATSLPGECDMLVPIVLPNDPIANLQATTKQYVDNGSVSVTKTGTQTMVGALGLPSLLSATAGVFTNTQMNIPNTFNLNGTNILSEFQYANGTSGFSTDALTAAITVPASAAIYQGNALAAYAVGNTGTAAAVGASLGCRMATTTSGANNGCWGINNYAIGMVGQPAKLTGMEDDLRWYNSTDTIDGIDVVGMGTVSAVNSRAIGITAQNPAAPWNYGFISFDHAAVQHYIGATADTSAGSQPIFLASRNASGTLLQASISTDLNGNLFLNTQTTSLNVGVNGNFSIGGSFSNANGVLLPSTATGFTGTGSLVLHTSPTLVSPTLNNPVVSGAVKGTAANAVTIDPGAGATNDLIVNNAAGSTANFSVDDAGNLSNKNGTIVPSTVTGSTGTGKIVLSTGTGYSGTCASTTTLTVVNGIITGCS